MNNQNKKTEMKIVGKAALNKSFVSGTFRAIGLENTARALNEVSEMKNLTPNKLARLVVKSRKVAAGRADTMGYFEGMVIAQKIFLRN